MTKLLPEWLDSPSVKALVNIFAKENMPMRFVGGSVRDALLGKTAVDIDIATPLLPEKTIPVLEKQGIKIVPIGLKYGIYKALILNQKIEITTLRKDVETYGREADVAFIDDWKEDATRRDFTMNALYLSPEGELFDYFGGEEDAKAGRVRFIGNPKNRITEDYLRILRFFRFSAHYSKSPLDEAGLAACTELASNVEILSGFRMQHELLKLMTSERSFEVLSIMKEKGILKYLILGPLNLAPIKILDVIHAMPLTKLTSLLTDHRLLEQMSERLGFSQVQHKMALQWINAAQDINPDMTAIMQKKLVRRMGGAAYLEALKLACALSGRDYAHYKKLEAIADWEVPVFPISGGDLMAKGVPAGKIMGETLARLEAEWEKSDYAIDREGLLRLV
jgi:poly(A) polymerase